MLEDQTGYSINNDSFPDGYSIAIDFSGDTYKKGVINTAGEIIVPVEYEYVNEYGFLDRHIWSRGYFCVTKDGLSGYVSEGGNVTCPIEYPEEQFYNEGLAARVNADDGTCFIISADGVKSAEGSDYAIGFANGLFWAVDDSQLIDWHGNVIFEDYYNVSVSSDGQYIILQKTYDEKPLIYKVDGAPVDAVSNSEEMTEEETNSENNMQNVSKQSTEETAAAARENTTETEDTVSSDTDAESTEAEKQLLTAALQLLSTDFETNKDNIVIILQQAKAGLDSKNADAGVIVNSAITLLNAGSSDPDAISTIINTALGML
jgi:hypothetical protein